MNRFFVSSSASLFSNTSLHFLTRNFSTKPPLSLWRRKVFHANVKPITSRFHVQCISTTITTTTKTVPPRSKRSRKKIKPELSALEEDKDKDAFYVVRKGDIIGVYKNLSDCQAQVGSMVCDPSVSVFKGYSLHKDAEEYLISRGIKNATYTINAADAKEDLFGALVRSTYQKPTSSKDETPHKPSLTKWSHEVLDTAIKWEEIGSASSTDKSRKHLEANHPKCVSCTLAFDGASKGNPGKSGAGAVLKADDGSLVCRLREGLGVVSNNVAEYRAILLGLKHALKKGFSQIRVQGDSKLVYMQVQGLWKCKSENMVILCKEVKELVDKFILFEISHVLRDSNSEADVEANLAVKLKDGELEEICEER
ncbi:hypothetical protein ACHQM5_026803 [Ranunculus cassubicifolius]